jgi:hypothetical protein
LAVSEAVARISARCRCRASANSRYGRARARPSCFCTAWKPTVPAAAPAKAGLSASPLETRSKGRVQLGRGRYQRPCGARSSHDRLELAGSCWQGRHRPVMPNGARADRARNSGRRPRGSRPGVRSATDWYWRGNRTARRGNLSSMEAISSGAPAAICARRTPCEARSRPPTPRAALRWRRARAPGRTGCRRVRATGSS